MLDGHQGLPWLGLLQENQWLESGLAGALTPRLVMARGRPAWHSQLDAALPPKQLLFPITLILIGRQAQGEAWSCSLRFIPVLKPAS